MQEPNSLWTRVLKARYFPNCDFKEAEKGYRASWSRESLIDARDLILNGSIWHVINGLGINIWKDNWLPPPAGGLLVPTSQIHDLSPTLVHSLIDWDHRVWDLSSISHVIPQQICNLIRLIPIGNGSDSNATSTFLNLFRKRLSTSPLCPICLSCEESMEHILLLYPWVELVWFGSPVGLQINKSKVSTLDKWVLDLLASSESKDDRGRVLTMVGFFCWAIWKARCSFVYQGMEVCPTKIISTALALLNEFQFARCIIHDPIISVIVEVNHWVPPPNSYTKVNCDAAWNANTCRAGLGILIRDCSGSLVGGLTRPNSCGSVLIVESEAILEGMKLAKELNVSKLVVESDSKVVIANLRQSSSTVNWRICPIIRAIRLLGSSFHHIRWDWIPREENRAAHVAASLAIGGGVRLNRWATQPPLPLIRGLRNDGLPCPPTTSI
ncbi:hypothetical protein M0R45_006274 [Rubus argutus]|uniref:RNase H type-1 domain-containing protein n=1 Tax=Rubus argutus TaxID=59490 RepID=A0AAW1YQ49_RUBAR